MNKFVVGEIVVVIHGNRADVTKIVGVATVHRLSRHNFKPIKFAYHIKFGASEGFYLDARHLKKLDGWTADKINKAFRF